MSDYQHGYRGQNAYGSGARSRRDDDAWRADDRDDNPGLWDRMKGELREGWESLTGNEDDQGRYGGRRQLGRPIDEQGSYGSSTRRGYPFGYGGTYGGGNGGPHIGHVGSHGGFGGSEREGGRGPWERAREEMSEGWQQIKQTFSGKGPKGYKRSDERIREDVCDRLTMHAAIDASEIEVAVRDGEVTLSGMVDERHMKRLAYDVVEDVVGVTDVSNHIRVRRGEQSESATPDASQSQSRNRPREQLSR